MKKSFALILLSFSLLNIAKAINNPYSFGLRITGHGKPMLLIPGSAGSADTYNDVVAHYKDHYKCYVITLAGFAGQPPSGVHNHLLQKQRDDIIRFIVDEHIKKPVLVGFSFGGGLALWIATTRPDLIGPIIDLDATPFDTILGNPNMNIDSLKKADSAKYARMQPRTPAAWAKKDSAYYSPTALKSARVYLSDLVTDTAHVDDIMRWDEASDFKTLAYMDVEIDTLDMRRSVGRLNSPMLVLGSWRSFGTYKTKAAAEKEYAMSFIHAKNVTIVFSENGKHFLMYDDFNWMVNQMDAFLLKNE